MILLSIGRKKKNIPYSDGKKSDNDPITELWGMGVFWGVFQCSFNDPWPFPLWVGRLQLTGASLLSSGCCGVTLEAGVIHCLFGFCLADNRPDQRLQAANWWKIFMEISLAFGRHRGTRSQLERWRVPHVLWTGLLSKHECFLPPFSEFCDFC